MFSRIELKDGTIGNIVEIWESGVAYEFDPADHSAYSDDDPVTFAIKHEDIARVIA